MNSKPLPPTTTIDAILALAKEPHRIRPWLHEQDIRALCAEIERLRVENENLKRNLEKMEKWQSVVLRLANQAAIDRSCRTGGDENL